MSGAHAVAVRVAILALAAIAAAWALNVFGAVYVSGDSMAPTMRRGDLVLFTRRAARLEEGDIVWVAKRGWPDGVLHRIREITLDETLVLQGDANPVPDLTPVQPASVKGVVLLVVPTGRVASTIAGILGWYNHTPQSE